MPLGNGNVKLNIKRSSAFVVVGQAAPAPDSIAGCRLDIKRSSSARALDLQVRDSREV